MALRVLQCPFLLCALLFCFVVVLICVSLLAKAESLLAKQLPAENEDKVSCGFGEKSTTAATPRRRTSIDNQQGGACQPIDSSLLN
jgi:hypothetical protein